MRKVFKYTLPLEGGMLPVVSEVVHFAFQKGVATIWAEVDSEETELEYRDFHVFGTGQPIPGHCQLKHQFTAIDGQFVWHLYER